jgi:hypothetical protein
MEAKGCSVPRVNNARVRCRLTPANVRERLFFELLRRFGVSGRKRSYQTLSVAARSSRRPFSLSGPSLPVFFGPRPREACSPTAFRGRLLRESAPGIPNAGKRVGAAGFPTAPAFRHSEVLLSVARPGSGWAAKVNFSKNNNSISSFVQSHQVKYKMEYADICFVDRNSTRRPSGEKSFPWVKAEPTRILQIVPSFDV